MVNQKYDIKKSCPVCGMGMVFEAKGDDAFGREYCPECGYEDKDDD